MHSAARMTYPIALSPLQAQRSADRGSQVGGFGIRGFYGRAALSGVYFMTQRVYCVHVASIIKLGAGTF